MPVSTGNDHIPYKWGRRQFVTTLLTALAVSPLTLPKSGIASGQRRPTQALTIQQVIDLILKQIPGAPFQQTVDTVKSGNPAQQVKGIITTMFATDAVVSEAVKGNSNFIIAHEPTFYNHLDETAWLDNNEVYRFKRALLEKHDIVVWRFHDYWHAHKPDGILMGVLTELGWAQYYDPQNPHMVSIPGTSLGNIIALAKQKLGISKVKVIGDLSQVCKRVAIMPGASGGKPQIAVLQKEKPDLLICGEINEWETSEYVRDDRFMGSKTALVVLGHAVSEEAGMQWLVQWLQPQIPGIKIAHIPSGDPFTTV